MKAVIMAGGKGTRLGNLTRTVPKPMIQVCGKPVLEHQLEVMSRHGISEVFLLTEHLADVIEKGLGGRDHSAIQLRFMREERPLGTAGALRPLQDRMDDDFIVIFGDLIMNMDLRRLLEVHKRNRSDVTLVVHPTDHPQDSDLVETDAQDRITKIHLKPHAGPVQGLGNSGVHVFSRAIFDYLGGSEKLDLMKGVLPRMLQEGRGLYAYNTDEYIKDMGTPDRLARVERDILAGKVYGH